MLFYGDCLDILPSIESADLVFADLPYGTTACPWDSIIDLDKLWAELLRIGKPNTAFVFTAQQPFTTKLASSKLDLLKYELIWEKPNGTSPFQAKSMPMKKHENILVFCREKTVYNPQMLPGTPYKWNSKRSKGEAGGIKQIRETPIDNPGVRYPSSVLEFPQERGLHPTQKPVSLLEWIIKTYSNPGDIVLDPCMGSGTTGVACFNTDRKFIGIEKDEAYYKIACDRLIKLDVLE